MDRANGWDLFEPFVDWCHVAVAMGVGTDNPFCGLDDSCILAFTI
jgi:hypothetical protein